MLCRRCRHRLARLNLGMAKKLLIFVFFLKFQGMQIAAPFGNGCGAPSPVLACVCGWVWVAGGVRGKDQGGQDCVDSQVVVVVVRQGCCLRLRQLLLCRQHLLGVHLAE